MSPLQRVRSQLKESCLAVNRDLDLVTLIAVSKTWGMEEILPLIDEEQSVFGENKLQELEVKAPALPANLEWHFIGGLQRNKVRKVLQYSNWIHSIDSLKLLNATDRIAGEEGKKPKLFLQINLEGEATKGGFTPTEIHDIVIHAQKLPNIILTGLMCIPAFRENSDDMRPLFKQLRDLRDELQSATGIDLPHLSMGMSNDYMVAIEEGATHVRVGSALFGTRNYQSVK